MFSEQHLTYGRTTRPQWSTVLAYWCFTFRQCRSVVLDYTRDSRARISGVLGHLVWLLVQFVSLSFDNKPSPFVPRLFVYYCNGRSVLD